MHDTHPLSILFFFNHPPPTEIYPLSLPAALPIPATTTAGAAIPAAEALGPAATHEKLDLGVLFTNKRSEEHTSELQSRLHLVCRLLLEKKKRQTQARTCSPLHTTDNSVPARFHIT